jgi:hypothetical protein
MERNTELTEVVDRLDAIVTRYEETLNWKRPGNMDERVQHVVSEYRSIADNSIFEVKRVHSDMKTHFKALEIITEGLTSEGLNHGQKRVIANHIITMLRSAVDKIDQYEYTYSAGNFERYNFFRTETPEKRLYQERNELKRRTEDQEKMLKTLKEKHPDTFKELEDNLPF